jgi:hypothetical protein
MSVVLAYGAVIAIVVTVSDGGRVWFAANRGASAHAKGIDAEAIGEHRMRITSRASKAASLAGYQSFKFQR